MLLTTALRLAPGRVVAFTGAGGKTTSMARLASEASAERPVVLTTTTRLGREQAGLASSHLVVSSVEEVEALPDLLKSSASVLVTGPPPGGGAKWSAPPAGGVDRLRELASAAGATLAIEADGARGRSLKAPADHEPVIPAFTDLVVPTVGMDVLHKSLDPEYVHRHELVAGLLKSPPGHRIEVDDIAAVLASSRGSLKGVPQGAEVRVLLNKVDDSMRLDASRRLAGLALREASIRAVIAGSAAGEDPVREVYGRLAGIVLAAGASTRLGVPKQLVLWKERPLVWHAVRAAVDAGLSPVLVVVGHEEGRVREALGGQPVGFISNPSWEAGQSTSLKAGLRTVENDVEGAVFLLADMPYVTADLAAALVQAHRGSLAPIVAPRAGGRWANPVLFDRVTFPDLMSLEGDVGGRPLFDRYRMQAVEWEDKILLDIDTPDDVERLTGLQEP